MLLLIDSHMDFVPSFAVRAVHGCTRLASAALRGSPSPAVHQDWVWASAYLIMSNGFSKWDTLAPPDVAGRTSVTLVNIFAILYMQLVIAVLVSAVQRKMKALKYGLSPVVERGHTVVLGFNSAVLSVIRQLCLANESEGGGVVAVLARGNTVEMAAEVNAFLSDEELKGTKVVFRNGTRLRIADLEFVAVPFARAVIAVADQRCDADTADAEMLQVMLNLSGVGMTEGAAIVAEVRDVDSTDFIKQVRLRRATMPHHRKLLLTSHPCRWLPRFPPR